MKEEDRKKLLETCNSILGWMQQCPNGGLLLDAATSLAKALKPILEGESVIIPKTPPQELLVSMVLRFDHGFGVPGYYDSLATMLGRDESNEPTHAERMEMLLRQMEQVYEEVAGTGFYHPERKQYYADILKQSRK